MRPIRVVFAVLLRIGIQARASAHQIRPFTFADIANVTAAEAVIGLAVVLAIYQNFKTTDVDATETLRG